MESGTLVPRDKALVIEHKISDGAQSGKASQTYLILFSPFGSWTERHKASILFSNVWSCKKVDTG